MQPSLYSWFLCFICTFVLAAYKPCTDPIILSDDARHVDSAAAEQKDETLDPNKWYRFEGPNGKPRRVGKNLKWKIFWRNLTHTFVYLFVCFVYIISTIYWDGKTARYHHSYLLNIISRKNAYNILCLYVHWHVQVCVILLLYSKSKKGYML